jgi:CheY-like chemotaxis protein
MVAVELSAREIEHPGVGRWALLVEPDLRRRRLATPALEEAGYAVAVVSDVTEAVASLAIMTPALIVVGDLPGASHLLDRARAIGIETTRHGDVVGEELA